MYSLKIALKSLSMKGLRFIDARIQPCSGQQSFLIPNQHLIPSPDLSLTIILKPLPQNPLQNGDVPLQKHPVFAIKRTLGSGTTTVSDLWRWRSSLKYASIISRMSMPFIFNWCVLADVTMAIDSSTINLEQFILVLGSRWSFLSVLNIQMTQSINGDLKTWL